MSSGGWHRSRASGGTNARLALPKSRTHDRMRRVARSLRATICPNMAHARAPEAIRLRLRALGFAREQSMNAGQFSLFEQDPPLPQGCKYERDIIQAYQERELVARLADLPFRSFEFQGYLGKRRVVSFGWQYDFSTKELRRAEDIPAFLLPLREKAAAFAGLTSPLLQHVLVTEYAPGAAIGWHRDKGVFGEVVGISLVSSCMFRLRRRTGTTWQRASFTAEPRSAYLLQGPARTEWEHSIPAVDGLRYSITFRSLRQDEEPSCTPD
jgi:alkylated DNA repair dioxygenase AlkB